MCLRLITPGRRLSEVHFLACILPFRVCCQTGEYGPAHWFATPPAEFYPFTHDGIVGRHQIYDDSHRDR